MAKGKFSVAILFPVAAIVQRISGIYFYALGSVVLILIVLMQKGWDQVSGVLHSLALPLLFVDMLYGGSSFYLTLTRNQRNSIPLLLIVVVPLVALFLLFAYFDFGLAFAD